MDTSETGLEKIIVGWLSNAVRIGDRQVAQITFNDDIININKSSQPKSGNCRQL